MRKPNVIYIYADDLGRGMLSCYGQRFFKTPHIDRLAVEGLRFTQAYGCAVCAPARASLLTGYHDCHAGTWSFTKAGIYEELSTGGRRLEEIKELINNTGFRERPDDVFLADVAKAAGLVTGQVSDHVLANYDTMATLAELLGVGLPAWKDGLSYLPVLQGREQPPHDHVVFAGNNGPALVTPDGWKVRYLVPVRRFQLFHLPDDCREERNLAAEEPARLRAMATRLVGACDGNLHHGTWQNHKAVRVDEYLAGSGPEDAFPKPVR